MNFDNAAIAEKLAQDPEFLMNARHWTGGIILEMGEQTVEIAVASGKPVSGPIGEGDVIHLAAPAELWGPLLQNPPPRYFNDIAPLTLQGLEVKSDGLFFTQYYAAIMRMVEVMRPPLATKQRDQLPVAAAGSHDAPVGRYINLELDGHIHRIYYEECGQGIPILMQHTAGAHGTQWRHMFEFSELTDNFRLIAYDLPFHGKSVPPTGKEWWTETYKLTGEFVRSVPLALSEALALDRPVFMGCSVGGAMALDLASKHPDAFRAVISVEGALNFEHDIEDLVHTSYWHPQVSNEFKGRVMYSVTSPLAPEAYRRETIQTYMAGWPPVFIGDLYYYNVDFDVTDEAANIDTSKVAVYILNGEYDFSGSWEMGEAAHKAIPGSHWVKMDSLGHFPMSEDPVQFVKYLQPILTDILDA